MAKSQRTSFAKLQRERDRQARQAEKRERRRAKRDEEAATGEVATPAAVGGAAGDEPPAPGVLPAGD